MSLRITAFQPNDQAVVRTLIERGLAARWGVGEADAALNVDLGNIAESYAHGAFLVGWDGAALVAAGALVERGDGVGEITRLSVAESHRRQGCGRTMVHALLDVARARGLDRVVLETTAQWEDAVALYESCGFVRTHVTEGQFGLDQHFVLHLHSHREGRGLVLAAVGVLAFSFSLPFTKIAVRGLDPMLAAVGRAAVAGVLAAFALVVTRAPRPPRELLGRFALVIGGVVFGFPVLIAYALRHTESLHGSVVNGLLPLATAGFAVWRAGERPSPTYWGCSLLGFGAVVGYVLHEGGGSLNGADALLVLAVLAAAVGYTEGALLSRRLGGWQVICWTLVFGMPITWAITIVTAAQTGLTATAGQWAAFGYTAVVSMFLGFFAWYAGLARAGIARAGQLQLAQPALSMLWGWPLLGEQLSAAAVATIVVVLLAVAAGRRATIKTTRDGAAPGAVAGGSG